jgi:hypothetical protein
MSIPYQFLPWARRGLARSHQNIDTGNNALATRPKVNVGLTLQAKQDGAGAGVVSGNIDLTLYGPGDIIGIDPRLIVRTEPKANITNFEPNYLAAIDFDPPDFPWLLTPAKANSTNNLRPWLVLVVFEKSVGTPRVKPGQPLPSVLFTADKVASELPNLSESWLWAHAQAVSTAANSKDLADELVAKPARNISRLVCPRRLVANKHYVACVVPAFEAGRLRGLGQPVPDAMTTLTPAWSEGEVELPIYYHWEFSTGPLGDIETLARRLRTPQHEEFAPLVPELKHIGEQPVAVDGDHLLFTGTTPDRTIFEGAMVSLAFKPAPASAHPLFAQNLESMLNSSETFAVSGTEKAASVPTLSPPIYGEHPAKRHSATSSQLTTHWLDELNLQPRYRLAAGWGAEIVRQHQDEFMQAAWTQVGNVLAAERALSLSRLAHDVLKRIHTRHLDKLPEHRLFAVLGAAHARIKVASNQSLYGHIAAATLPAELFDGSMRRLTSTRRPTFRMAQYRERALGADQVSLTAQMSSLVSRFANATHNLSNIDPNHFQLSGIEQVAEGKRTLPKMDDIWRKGLLTDQHYSRFLELQQASNFQFQGDVKELLSAASRKGTEGLLLRVQDDGQLSVQSLKIDGRNGNLKPFAMGRVSSNGGMRALRFATLSLAAVPVQALRVYGNKAVFASLPIGTLGGDKPVAIDLKKPGRFSPQPPKTEVIPEKILPTITMPPAIKEHAVLQRYSNAFKRYQQTAESPQLLANVEIAPVNFALTSASTQVRNRLDPSHTVPARLASMLSFSDHPMHWSQATGMSHDVVSTRLDKALLTNRLHYVIPRCFDRVMAYPHLPYPLSKKLEKLAPEVFLPGVGKLPDDFIMAVKTNPRFVEALMLGANHEMGRELLWQGFPTDQRGTPFQHFWQRLDPKFDIEEIHKWHELALGKQPGSGEMLVLLIRGQLLERFPTLAVYAYPKAVGDIRPGGGTLAAPIDMDAELIKLPVMQGHLGKDISYFGFEILAKNIDPNVSIEKYFFILEEHMTEPRFGFDEPDQEGQNGPGWQNIDWSEMGVEPGQHFGSAALKQAPPAIGEPQWQTPHAATVADALLQQPFRGFYPGASLKMPK